MTPWTLAVGLTLVCFVWQGALIALAVAVVLRLTRGSSPRLRYAIACAGLAAMLVAPGATVFTERAPSVSVARRVTAAAPQAAVNAGAARAAVMPEHPPAGEGAGTDSRDAARILPAIVALWLAGVALLLVRLGIGWRRVRRLRQAALALPVSRWAGVGRALAERLRLSVAIRFIDAALVDTPVVIGWLRPVILLPVAALANLSPAQVEAILAHELAHIRRHDFLVNALQAVAETLLFYHPAVWWLSARIRVEREHCCDDIAVEVCGNPVEYAEALAHLAAWSTAPALAVGATSGPLLDRVRRLLRLEPQRPNGGNMAALALTSLLALIVVFTIGLRTTAAARAGGDDDATWMTRLAELHRIVPDFHGHLVPGPMDVNRMMHCNLFPEPVTFPTDDPRNARAWGVSVIYPGGELAMKGFTARSLIRYAYGLDENTVVEVPNWMDNESVSLAASAPTPRPDPQDLLLAIRTALDAQLHVTLRRQVRDYPVYALVLANADGSLGPNIRRSVPGACVSAEMLRASVSGTRDFQRRPSCGVDSSVTRPSTYGASIRDLARAIQRPWLDRPVVDRTGLEGAFDVRLQLGLVPVSVIASVHPDATAVIERLGARSLQHALPEQLGLALEDATAPYDVVVVDAAVRSTRP